MDTEKPDYISGADAAVLMLNQFGVKHVFGVCGDTSLPFYDSLESLGSDITHILARDERSAGYMADVYARLTNRVGVVEGPSGAGATYMVPGIAEANGTTIPVLAITSDIPVSGRDKFVLTECDQESLFKPFTKYTRVTEAAENIPTAFRAAFNAMTTGAPGCAHIGLPYDVLKKKSVNSKEIWVNYEHSKFPAYRAQSDHSSLLKATELISEKSKPVIVCGGGVLHSQAVEELKTFAELIQSPVGTTISAKGTISDYHPLALGTIGTNGSTAGSRDVIRSSDLVIYIGCRVGSVTSEKRTNPQNHEKSIIHIDIDPKSIGANYKTDVALVGDAKTILGQLIESLNNKDISSVKSEWGSASCQEARKQKQERFNKYATSDQSPIHGERLVSELQKALPKDAIVVSDPGTPTPFLCAFYNAEVSGRSFIFHRHHGGLGFSLPGVIGAHFAETGRKVIGIMGDGSFGFSSGELETIARYNLPVTLIVLNNSGFGWIRAGQNRSYGARYYSTNFSATDHAAVASAYGVKSWSVTDPNDIENVVSKAVAYQGPTLVDIYTKPLEDSEVPVTAFLG